MLLLLAAPHGAFAAASGTTPPPADDSPTEEVDVEKIKQKYWARGNETEMGVVQNRLYPKRHRIELGVSGVSLSGDPFLSTYTLGISVGFHFSEFLALHVVHWQAFVSPSSALTTLQNDLNTTTNTNEPRRYIGLEARASVLYGKLSLLGAAILYFDSYFSLGGGRITTFSGNNVLVSAGLGQQIHVSKVFSINLDYKFMWYNETILRKVADAGGPVGSPVHSRTNLSNGLSLGLSLFLDIFG